MILCDMSNLNWSAVFKNIYSYTRQNSRTYLFQCGLLVQGEVNRPAIIAVGGTGYFGVTSELFLVSNGICLTRAASPGEHFYVTSNMKGACSLQFNC